MSIQLALLIALRHLAGRKRQSLLAVLGIVVGGGIFALMVAVTAGQSDYLRQRLIEVSPHITVTADHLKPRTSTMLLDSGKAIVQLSSRQPPTTRKELKPYTEL